MVGWLKCCIAVFGAVAMVVGAETASEIVVGLEIVVGFD